jgi:arylamine N-acetyltransferase
MGKVMSEFPETFQGWVTRHISDFNGCNWYQSRWNKSIKNKCPSCNKPNEDTEHITRCTDPTRTALYHNGVSNIKKMGAG